VNRWAHGSMLMNTTGIRIAFAAGAAGANEIGRNPFGNITIANSDSAARASTRRGGSLRSVAGQCRNYLGARP